MHMLSYERAALLPSRSSSYRGGAYPSQFPQVWQYHPVAHQCQTMVVICKATNIEGKPITDYFDLVVVNIDADPYSDKRFSHVQRHKYVEAWERTEDERLLQEYTSWKQRKAEAGRQGRSRSPVVRFEPSSSNVRKSSTTVAAAERKPPHLVVARVDANKGKSPASTPRPQVNGVSKKAPRPPTPNGGKKSPASKTPRHGGKKHIPKEARAHEDISRALLGATPHDDDELSVRELHDSLMEEEFQDELVDMAFEEDAREGVREAYESFRDEGGELARDMRSIDEEEELDELGEFDDDGGELGSDTVDDPLPTEKLEALGEVGAFEEDEWEEHHQNGHHGTRRPRSRADILAAARQRKTNP